jgi:hypothetical protein
VFAYLDELDKHSEWQQDLVSARILTDGPVRAGTRVTNTRKVPGGPREMTYAVGSVLVESVADGARTRVTVRFDLEGHGLEVLIAPFARRQARKQVHADQATLKAILERGGPGQAG